MMAAETTQLKLHLEPNQPIEVSELTGALGALAHQYQSFAKHEGATGRSFNARLLVSSVSQGSIDILFQPEVIVTGVMMLPLIDKSELVLKFAKHLKSLIDFFLKKEGALTDSISAKDCDDVTAIVKPIAQHGGTQTITTINGPVAMTIINLNAAQATETIAGAAAHKATLLPSAPERKERVSLTFKRLDTDEATTEGRSPDKGIIAEIDPKPHAILFTDDMSPIKREIIDNEAKPFDKVYFVDVEVSRVESGKITAYRIVGYHGKDDLSD